MCTARCLGDSACITGCFARFGNDNLNNLLQCSIEDYKCINIAIIPPGAQPPEEVPLPPKELVSDFTPASMEGSWYKVLGWNRQYDCFDCQKNSFTVDGRSSAVDVDFSMVARRAGKGEISSPLHMKEKMDFDDASFRSVGGKMMKSRRTAHTEGRMFGLTFWENWYVIGENKPNEEPFKFVYYTGKTLQNTYSGAFVYARTPSVPESSMAAIQRVARDAGMDPTKFCRIRNGCFAGRGDASEGLPQISSNTLSLAAATTAGQIAEGDAVEIYDARRFTTSINIPWKLKLQESWYNVLDYIEDPHEAARWMFDQQQQMIWPSSVSRSPS